MKLAILGGISPARFLRDHWQKKPLLIRQAVPGFGGLVEKRALFRLAGGDDVESRLIKYGRAGWQATHGPFPAAMFATLPRRHWTLLVHDLNHHLAAAADLIQRFAFIPHARIDDVMVSYAAEGGGVGPHFDSYDVFLLQGMGRRRWQIAQQKNHEFLDGAPLKILRDFHPEQEWVLDPGDMLYLPPGCAHDGVAMTECMTYSIGFRAPSAQELASAFLDHLQDNLALDGMYADPDLAAMIHAGEISAAMVKKTTAIVEHTLWGRDDVEEFLGVYLSEPKPHVLFDARKRPLSRPRFLEAVATGGIRLALKSRMLFRRQVFYLNGERFRAPRSDVRWLVSLADNRSVGGAKICAETTLQLYDWYRAGFIEPMGATANRRSANAKEDSA